VPFEVAQEVGRIRDGADISQYPVDKGARKILSEQIDEQKRHFPVPTDRLITIEHDRRTMIVNACFGSKVNETIGMLLSTLMAARIGESIGIRTDPYRIILELPVNMDPNIVKRYLLETEPEAVDDLIRLALKNSSHLRWRMIHVAKKFCAIEREVDYKKISIKRLMSAFMDTPLYEETVEKVIWEKMDLTKTKEVLAQLQKGDIDVQITGLSPIGLEGLEAFKALVAPQMPDRAILMTLKSRLEDERIKILCLKCKKTRTKRIGKLPDKITCENCGAKLVAVTPTYKNFTSLLRKKRHSKDEAKTIKRLYKNANLVFGHGKKAVLALRARGVGPNTAARILAMHYETEEEFLRSILSAEITYARTRRFWD
jgi:ATP-dependent Lhr-like helicase